MMDLIHTAVCSFTEGFEVCFAEHFAVYTVLSCETSMEGVLCGCMMIVCFHKAGPMHFPFVLHFVKIF